MLERGPSTVNEESKSGDICPPWGIPEVDINIPNFGLNTYQLNQDSIKSPKLAARS